MLKSFNLILLSLAFSYLGSQEYSFIPYSVEDGLSQTQVHSICSDNLGNLWLGTGGGVSRFDGAEFNNFSKENGLADNSSVEIISHNGFIWIATKQGITRIKNKQVATVNLSQLSKGNYITAITFDKKGHLWVGIQNIGLVEMEVLNDPKFSLKEIKTHLQEKQLFIRSLKCDQKGSIWIGAKGYIGYYKADKWNQVYLPFSANNISDIDQDLNGIFWISTYNSGVFKYDSKANEFANFNIENGLISVAIRSIFVDKKNRVWLSSKIGVSRIENDIIKNFNSKNGLSEENINTIGEDLENNIWLGSDGSGAFRFTGEKFVNYTTNSGLPSNYIMSICQDLKKNIWLSTYGEGICCLKNNNIINFNINNSAIKNNTIWTSLCTNEGKLLFGSSGGLIEISNEQINTYSNVDWLPSNKITSLYEDRKNRIWIGGKRGLTVLDNQLKYVFNEESEFKGRNLRTICSFNELTYVGTSTGIYSFDGELNSKKLRLDKALSGDIYCLENWKDSLLFIGTGNGLYIYNKENIYQLTLHSSFSANYINFLKIENNTTLWVGTNFGIFEISIPTLKSNQLEIRHHTVNNGLKSVETNLNACFIDQNKNIWMGTGKGLAKYKKKSKVLENENHTPIPRIHNVQLFLKETNWKKYDQAINPYTFLPESLSLNSKKNYLTFYFSAANLSKNNTVNYQFKLDNFDQEWSPNYTQNSFTYANLPPGEFNFKVRASTDNNNWSEPATFSFKIDYPYYQKWWFIIVEGFLVFSVIYLIWKWRSNVNRRNIKTQNLVYKSNLLSLEQQSLNASMNRHFIFNALNSIQYFINTQDKLSANKYLSSFAKLIRKNLDSSMSENNLVSLADELERLELYLSLEHMRFQTKFDYSIKIAPSIQTEAIEVPAMFMQPFVENSIWHGILPKKTIGKIEISISYNEKNELLFVIADNGIGVDKSLSLKSNHEHQSKGINITSNRIDVLRRLTKKNFTIIGPYQMNDSKNKPLGTKVEIILSQH